jgi:hypothetical protein
LVFVTEVESVYSVVRTESLYKTDTLHLSRVNFEDNLFYKVRQYRGTRIIVFAYQHYCLQIKYINLLRHVFSRVIIPPQFRIGSPGTFKCVKFSRNFTHHRSSISQPFLKLEIDMYFLTCCLVGLQAQRQPWNGHVG